MAKQQDKYSYEPSCGSSLDGAAADAIKMSKEAGGHTITLHFNSQKIPVKDTDTPSAVVQAYRDACDREYQAYLASPQYKIDKARQDAEQRKEQGVIDKLMTTLDGALSGGLNATLLWVKEYADHADNNTINIYRTDVLAKIKAAGWKKEFNKDADAETNPVKMGQNIMANVVGCMESGMPPHPMASVFVDRYLEAVKKSKAPKSKAPKQ